MEYPSCVVWYLNMESKTIKQRPTLTLFMEFWNFWWLSWVWDEKQCGLANCNECENWIQTSSHCNARIPFTLWLVFPDDVAVFRCAGRSRGWDCDRKAQCRGTLIRREAFDAWHPDRCSGHSTGCGIPDNPNCKALEDQDVVRIETCDWETTCSDIKQGCTPCWFRMEWGRAG